MSDLINIDAEVFQQIEDNNRRIRAMSLPSPNARIEPNGQHVHLPFTNRLQLYLPMIAYPAIDLAFTQPGHIAHLKATIEVFDTEAIKTFTIIYQRKAQFPTFPLTFLIGHKGVTYALSFPIILAITEAPVISDPGSIQVGDGRFTQGIHVALSCQGWSVQ